MVSWVRLELGVVSLAAATDCRPAAVLPTAVEPEAGEPEAGEPEAGEPEAVEPEAVELEAVVAGVGRPGPGRRTVRRPALFDLPCGTMLLERPVAR